MPVARGLRLGASRAKGALMSRAFILGTVLALAGCTGPPDLGPIPGDPDAPFPDLVPLEGELAPDAPTDAADEADALTARSDALQRRADALRPPVMSADDEARLKTPVSQ